VSGPDGQSIELQLERTAAERFEGSADAPRPGTYAVGATVRGDDGAVTLSSSTLASNSYPPEFVPGDADAEFLARLAATTGGREIVAGDVWDSEGLASGTRSMALLGPLMLLAALLWPVAVLLSRISVRGATVAGAIAGSRAAIGRAGRRVRDAVPTIGGLDPDNAPAPPVAPPPPPEPVEEPVEVELDEEVPVRSLDELLARKRGRRS
jgi:hypothetical protein